jgi:hypothetical protein
MDVDSTATSNTELNVNPPRARARARTIAHPVVRTEPYTLALDLVVAGFAIVGAVLIALVR